MADEGRNPKSPAAEFEREVLKTQPSMDKIERAEAARQSSLESLLTKGPLYCYRLSNNCDVAWVTFEKRRIWVREATGLGNFPCPVEPLAVYIPEDTSRFYDNGKIHTADSESGYAGGQYCYPRTDAAAAASPIVVKTGEIVTFAAHGSGGNGYFTYKWSGDEGLISYDRVIKVRFHTPGMKIVKVEVVSNNDPVFKECRVLVTKR
jgi:hypothetical protein